MSPNEPRWTCEEIESRLSDFADGLLEAGERRSFESHISSCARCAPLVARVTRLVARLQKLESVDPPHQLVSQILDRTLGPRAEKHGWRNWRAWLRPIWQPRFAYGAVSLLFTLAVLFQAFGGQWRKPTLAALNPANLYHAANRQAHLVYARSSKFITDLRVVYEIQSRLRPETESQPAPASKPAPGQSSNPDPDAPRQLNRANGGRDLEILACALPGLSRSLQ